MPIRQHPTVIRSFDALKHLIFKQPSDRPPHAQKSYSSLDPMVSLTVLELSLALSVGYRLAVDISDCFLDCTVH